MSKNQERKLSASESSYLNGLDLTWEAEQLYLEAYWEAKKEGLSHARNLKVYLQTVADKDQLMGQG